MKGYIKGMIYEIFSKDRYFIFLLLVILSCNNMKSYIQIIALILRQLSDIQYPRNNELYLFISYIVICRHILFYYRKVQLKQSKKA